MSGLANKHNAINLSQGFPNFKVSQELIDLINQNMNVGNNQYAPMPGVIELRIAIANKIKKLYGLNLNPEEEITITAGATQALFTAITAFVGFGDEVIIFEPAYDSYAPAVKLNGGIPKYISLSKGENPMEVDIERAEELIDAKEKADAPIAEYEGMPVQKGVGRFGPFIKWNSLFINVNKKYDFDNLSQANIEELIEVKKQKEIDKLIHHWEEEGIRVEKARWGRFNIIKGKLKIELPKTTKAEKLTLAQVQEIIEKKTPKKKTRKKAAKKKTTKKK